MRGSESRARVRMRSCCFWGRSRQEMAGGLGREEVRGGGGGGRVLGLVFWEWISSKAFPSCGVVIVLLVEAIDSSAGAEAALSRVCRLIASS